MSLNSPIFQSQCTMRQQQKGKWALGLPKGLNLSDLMECKMGLGWNWVYQSLFLSAPKFIF